MNTMDTRCISRLYEKAFEVSREDLASFYFIFCSEFETLPISVKRYNHRSDAAMPDAMTLAR